MKRTTAIVLASTLGLCGNAQPTEQELTGRQASSSFGATAKWPLDPALSPAKIRAMRNSAYRYCLNEKATDKECSAEQDFSLFTYANAFALVRIFRSEKKPDVRLPFAFAHQQDVTAFDRANNYCIRIYEDHGSRDARSLGPCISAALGADFFGLVLVP